MSLRIKPHNNSETACQALYAGMKATSLILLGSLLLTACGFHLRGINGTVSSIDELSLSCSSTDAWALCHHLKQTLQLHDITLNGDADIRLVISPIRQKSRVLSLQENASAAELGLSSEITYQLYTTADDILRHEQSIRINNSYRHESSALLAKDRERDDLQTQLSRQLAEEVVRQISVLESAEWLRSSTSRPNKASKQVD